MRVTVEKLAPTGEGIARTSEGVGFVAGALPGEDVEAEVEELRKNFWKGRATRVYRPSPVRVSGPHASCAGCDWAHFQPAPALEVKRELFLETMERIGGQRASTFGALPAVSSPLRYRMRSRFHVSGVGPEVAVGYFVPRTHRVEPMVDCEVISREVIALVPGLREAIAGSGVRVQTVTMLEEADASRHLAQVVVTAPAPRRGVERLVAGLSPLLGGLRVEEEHSGTFSETGADSLTLTVGGRPFPVSVDTFVQTNRFLIGPLYDDVRDVARGVAGGRALDAFGGGGLFAGALLDAGHAVTTVEASRSAVRDAERAQPQWADGARWTIVRSDVASFATRQSGRFDLMVVDPPRAGLGSELSTLLAERVSSRIVYVSCEPATLARDLPAMLAKGFRVAQARLYDLFAATHRIEAVVVLDRETGS